MTDETKEKELLIDEIQRRIDYLVSTDQIADAEKISIARTILNLIENGEKEQGELVQ